MPNFFPPEPIFPIGIDSFETLFQVFNTSETILTSNNQAWADEMDIKPVDADEEEIWGNNGFANIDGELFYYDTVEKDSNNKINKLKRICRNLGGTQTKYNPAGTYVRGFVVAEHHNQLLAAILRIQRTIGICTQEELNACNPNSSLDCKIQRLLGQDNCQDDFGCPNVDFDFRVLDKDPCNGTNTSFSVEIRGSFTGYRLDFGDGTFTTQDQSGTHLYAPNAKIDPIVNVTSTSCQVVQAPIERTNPDEPRQVVPQAPFIIDMPEIPDFPQITIPTINAPSTTFEMPTFLESCPTSTSGISITPAIPSVITFDPPLDIPNPIEFGVNPLPNPIEFGINPLPNPINFGPSPLPNQIEFGPAPIIQFASPPNITVQWGDAPQVTFASPPSISVTFESPPSLTCSFDNPPGISVNWGTPPSCNCTVSVQCCSSSMAMNTQSMAFRTAGSFADVDDDFLGSFNEKVEMVPATNIGLPSEISLKMPEIPDIRLIHDLPESIKIEVPEIAPVKLVTDIKDFKLVTDITDFKLKVEGMPDSIKLDTVGVTVELKLPEIMPKLEIDTSNLEKILGTPITIEVAHNIPTKMELGLSEELRNFTIPIVFKGDPIPMKFSDANIVDDSGQSCFRLVPCDPK